VELGSSQTESVTLARQVFGWFTEHDMDAFLSALHPDIQASPSIAGGCVLHGRDAVIRWLSELVDLGEEVELRPLDFEQRGDCVLVRGYVRHREGRALTENQVYWVCEIHHRQVVRVEAHRTRDAALAAC
jgi:hypothetical protein